MAAFAIIALVFLILKIQKRKVSPVVWAVVIAVVLLALAPILAPIYMNSFGIYRVRAVVLDERGTPDNDARVTCSIGGEIKKIEGGWECDIPSKLKPADGKLQVYATDPSSPFLVGKAELELKHDYNPITTIGLRSDTLAKVIGIVVDEENSMPLEGVQIGVVGYESEVVITKQGGNFSLPAHKANGQQVQLSAVKEGYFLVPEWHAAGDFPATVKLHRQHLPKRKPAL
ncbi:MAG TPA: hypothetical protein VI636_14455 [Candidatus Angelobacter sp.]